MKEKVVKLLGFFTVLQLAFLLSVSEASVFKDKTSEQQTKLSPGVTHIKESYRTGSVYESVNLLNINLNDQYTKLELSIPSPINALRTTSMQARDNSYLGHRVVGATNASFFTGTGMPANLLSINNEIINLGLLSGVPEGPTKKPVAFGISKSGTAIADYFNANIKVSSDSMNDIYIDNVNRQRGVNQTILYTSNRKSTGTNEWGVELVVKKASKNTKTLAFGDKISGEVVSMTMMGATGNSTVPSDGFVISAQGSEAIAQLNKLSIGSTVTLDVSIDKKWQDAQFILAAGPLLVKDKKVEISMPTNQSFASARHPRTAVGIDATGKNVFLVTVDGRSSGHSNGTNLQDLAKLLISKGAVSAINLDGGGSTAMAISKPGSLVPNLINKPADGSERRVSAILQAVSVAPPGKVQSFKLNYSSLNMIKDTSVQINAAEVIDQYLNPTTVKTSDIQWKVEGNVGTLDGNTFTAKNVGTGKIIATIEGISKEITVKVIDPREKPLVIDSLQSTTNWNADVARAKASISNSSAKETYEIGQKGLKLTYDFTVGEAGTKAAYITSKNKLTLTGLPTSLGVWVHGDGKQNWLRANIKDGAGKTHTINFTAQSGLNWTGWKYAQASLPNDLPLPVTFERLYVTQPVASLQSKGKLYFSGLEAIYDKNYAPSVYIDVDKSHWAYDSIANLKKQNLITGFPNGTFQANDTVTRAQAATLIARTFNLKSTKQSKFVDVPKTHYAYDDIAAVAEKGIVVGKGNKQFDPSGKLTRAEMAAIITRAYNLSGKATIGFKDLDKKHWAYKEIEMLVANDITTGFTDNTFRPSRHLNRAEFVTFLDRANQNRK